MKVIATTLALVSATGGANVVPPPQPLEPVPTPEQLAWQQLEYGMFCHFSMNTFYDQEWGEGDEDPARFNPTGFDARQWARVAKESGIRYLVITAKHHDGFCAFQTAQTDHSVASSPWRGGEGDVIRDVADACRDAGLMFGFYLSPWDRHEPRYKDQASYDEYFKSQLRELLTGYGAVGEVWFDGAGTEGHVYDWQGYYSLIRELQPHALIAICGPDIRWVGNEDGVAPETLWSVQTRGGESVWHPAECDVPIRRGQWFFHTDGEPNLRSLDELIDIYYKSVGRGAVLLLNVSPDRRGKLPDADAGRLRELWQVISTTFRTNLAEGKPCSASNVRGNSDAFGPHNALDSDTTTYWATDDAVLSATIEVDLGAETTFNRSMIQEHIALGQRVEEYGLEAWQDGGWRTVVEGTTIGYKRLDRFEDVTAGKVRLTIRQAKACPIINAFGLYRAEESAAGR